MRRYSLDTSALMDGWSRYYPIAVFPSLWERVDQMIDSGIIGMSHEAWAETQKKQDDLCHWAKVRKPDLVIPTCEKVQAWVLDIMACPKRSQLVDVNRDRSGADPFVIACAKAWDLTVVTAELLDPKRKKPKIPNVCTEMDVPFCSFLELLQKEQLQF